MGCIKSVLSYELNYVPNQKNLQKWGRWSTIIIYYSKPLQISFMKTIAQLTYIPLYTDHPKEKVQDLLEFVAQHDVEVDVNYLSTSVKGDTDVVFALIREVYDTMTVEDEQFRFHVELLSPTKE